MLKFLFMALLGLTGSWVIGAPAARADYDQRISLGLGIAQLKNPNETDFEVSAEYEYRLDPLLGLGATVNYIFATPGITFVAAPAFFVHPLLNEWLVSAAPLMEFGSSVGTHAGARLGTRIPVPLGVITLVPSVAVDLISGGPNWLFGLGIEF